MIQPLKGYILIEPIKEDERTASGVYVPEMAKDKPSKGTVISVGGAIFDGSQYYEPLLSIGDVVYYKKWANSEVKVDGKEFVFIEFKDLLGYEDGSAN